MKFIKMHALGNDFVLIHKADLGNADMITVLSNRQIGIGFDQAIIIDDFDASNTYFTITFLNADGSQAGGCGNGTRAAAGYFHKETGKKEFNIHITLPSGGVDIVTAYIIQEGNVSIKMPNPKFSAEQIPLSDLTLNPQALEIEGSGDFYYYQKGIQLKLNTLQNGFCVNVGNPHYVMMIDDYNKFLNFPLEGIGSYVEHHKLFPERINFEIIHVRDRNLIEMRVWERGTGITQACGTGACASVIAGVKQGLIDNKTTVIMDGGTLQIDYNPQTNDLFMQGDYHFVYEGHLL